MPKVISLLILALIGMIVADKGSVLSAHVLPVLNSLIVLKVLLIAILIILCLSAWVYSLKLSLKEDINIFDFYRHQDLGGVSEHKKTAELFCTSCLTDKRLSPVLTTAHYWRCLYKPCLKVYNNPNNPAPKRQAQNTFGGFSSRSRW